MILKFLERNSAEGDKYLDIIVTEDKTWVNVMNVEIKEQSKQWMHSNSPKMSKKFNTRTQK